MEKKFQVFVSSTFKDLEAERQEVMHALLELDCMPAGMELFPAANETQWNLIKKVIDDCDYYVLILAGRYGSISPEGLSYTEMEYQYAISISKPTIAFIHRYPGKIIADKTETTEEGKTKLADFRTLVEKKLCKHWETKQELAAVVSRSLFQLIKTNPAVGWVRATNELDDRAAMGLADCGYLVRYVDHEEPSLIGVGRNTTISYERAYRLLIYMLQNEKFKDYMAFDLAFERWDELLRQNHMQTCNIANEIFESMTSLFSHHGCENFRRIIVISSDQLKSKTAAQILGKFQEQETAWKFQYKGLNVETKVYIYPDKQSIETRRKIQKLHDFALFSDKKESLAIVETTLTAPTDSIVAIPECQVVTAIDRLETLKKGFEHFWLSSQKISSILTVNSEKQTGVVGQPAQEAFNRFNTICSSKTEQCAIVIETGYFDLRTPHDEDRLQYIDDAFWLFEAVQKSCSNIKGSIFLDAFINNFTSNNVCNIKACGENMDFEIKDNRATMIHDLLCMISQKYTKYDLNPENFEVFDMRKTRNKVTDVIKRALRKQISGIYEENCYDTIVNINIDNDSEHINIGYRDTDTYKITPLCTALMAQHYFDLYSFALKKKSKLKELWIFDFNRFTERDSVRKGAEASFKLHSWPKGFSLHIVNCIYNSDGKTGTIELINGP